VRGQNSGGRRIGGDDGPHRLGWGSLATAPVPSQRTDGRIRQPLRDTCEAMALVKHQIALL